MPEFVEGGQVVWKTRPDGPRKTVTRVSEDAVQVMNHSNEPIWLRKGYVTPINEEDNHG